MLSSASQTIQQINEFGFGWVRAAGSADLIAETLQTLTSYGDYGSPQVVEDLPLKAPGFTATRCARLLQGLADQLLGTGSRLVTGLYFDKAWTAQPVGPHQDLFVPVNGRIDDPAFLRWSARGGYHYVSPPDWVLRESLVLRLHLDPCPGGMGEVSVWPSTHQQRWSKAQVDQLYLQPRTACSAEAGDVLAMSPLLLHCSEPATREGQRRVVHLVYSRAELPPGLAWMTPA